MSTAKELFKEVGYEKAEKSESVVLYTNGYGDTISFKENKHVVITPIQGCRTIIMTCLLENAIHKQCEELGWLDEKTEIKEARNQELTNFEYYKDEILDCCIDNLAVVKGIPKSCSKIDCNDCDFLTIQKECCEIAKDWLKQPYKKLTYKLTKFEKELLQCYPDTNSFKLFNSLNGMKEKGYFKNVDKNELIKDILENCEVIK